MFSVCNKTIGSYKQEYLLSFYCVCVDQERLMATRRGFLFFRVFLFFFVWNLGVHDNKTSWPFVPDKSNLFIIWSVIPQPIHRSATARLAVGTTFHYGSLFQSQLIHGGPDQITSVFSVLRRFCCFREYI